MDTTIIVSERNRPFWQLPIAALCYTASVTLLLLYFYYVKPDFYSFRAIAEILIFSIFLVSLGIKFSLQKRVHINLKEMKFRPTFELGPLKFGQWKKIQDPEYVSVFKKPIVDGGYIFEVNIWYYPNKHLPVYEQRNFVDAFKVGYELSEELDIDLLDATVANDYKWVNKKVLKEEGKIEYLE